MSMNLGISSYCLSSEKLSAPIRVVFLSDLHGKKFGNDNERLLELIAAQDPDLIAFVGDFFNNDADVEEIDAVCSLIARASKIAPVYYCLGNHEFIYNLRHDNELSDRIQEAGAILLDSCFIDATVNGNNIRLGVICLGHSALKKPLADSFNIENLFGLIFCYTFVYFVYK